MTREELEAKARDAGVANPEDYPNMDELSAAVAAAEGTGGQAAAGSTVVDNDTIPHTDTDAPLTTRSDATDLGVPMAPAKDPAAERVGPEDALDPNSRGDYSDRLDHGPHVAMVPQPVERDAETGERGPNVKAVEVAPGG